MVSGRNKPGETWVVNGLAGAETVTGSGLLARLSFRAIGDPFGSLPLTVGAVGLFDEKLGRNSLRAGESASADLSILLGSYGLSQNYHNPFNPWTTISYHLPERVFVSLKVYKALDEPVRTLQEGERPAGACTMQWDGKDSSGRGVASGIYLYRITAGNFPSPETGREGLKKARSGGKLWAVVFWGGDAYVLIFEDFLVFRGNRRPDYITRWKSNSAISEGGYDYERTSEK